MSEDRNKLTAEVEITTDRLSLTDAYEMRDVRSEQAERSFEEWQDMSDEYREILTVVMERSLESLHSSIDSWLPYACLRGVGGDKIDILVTVLMSNVESQVNLLSEATEFEQERVVRQITQRLMGEQHIEDDDEFLRWVQQCHDAGRQLTSADSQRLVSLAVAAGLEMPS